MLSKRAQQGLKIVENDLSLEDSTFQLSRDILNQPLQHLTDTVGPWAILQTAL